MGSTRLVHLMFFGAGIVVAYVCIQATDWIWGYFTKPPAGWVDTIGISVAGTAAFLAWRNPTVFSIANEVALELKKVTWPTRQESKWATIVVLITVVVAATFLSLYDVLWSWLTGLVYG
jgi:preprotein translocase SecE subunit